MKKVYLVKEYISETSDLDFCQNADYKTVPVGDTLHVCESKELAESLTYDLNKKYSIGVQWKTNKEYLEIKDCSNDYCYYECEEKEITIKNSL